MYFSLKKKIFYTVFALFVFMATLFLTMFTMFYAEKYSNDFHNVSKRNQYVMSLLYDNIVLQRELNRLQENVSEQVQTELSDKQTELTREYKINEDLQKNFNEQTKAFTEGMRIIGISSILSLVSIIVLGFLLQRWVIKPIKRLSEVTKLVSKGDFSHHVAVDKKQVFFDEFDTLANTFNTMISNIEHNISEIKNSEFFLQLLIDTIPDGIRVIDQDYRIVHSNKAYDAQFSSVGHTEKCFQAYGYDRPCPRSVFNCPFKEIKNLNSKSISLIQNVDGRPLSVNAAPLKMVGSDGTESFYIIESIRDLSEDIRFSHQQKIASLGFLATSVAHEMKNNLGSMRMIIESMLENDKDENQNKYLHLIYDQLLASIAIPERLLKLARHNYEAPEEFEVQDSIDEVISLLDYEAKRNGVAVKRDFVKGDCRIMGNAADFKMIILNLAQNAIKAMPSGGDLTFKTGKDRNYAMIDIQDTGIGIEKSKINHIFEPFYSDGQQNRQSGTGLGLAIVKSLVDKYKGQIFVESNVHEGTTFTIKFPRIKK
ncbi:MAG: HAMP domain-containing protein [Alphaproteobacteria bacterium]|nr:HAMP domain-containing protein [Alphaproteobacteria bacterium]